MASNETPSPSEWDPVTAVPLFKEFLQKQIQSGIGVVYTRERETHETDPASVAALQDALYGEAPLGVVASEDFDEGIPGHKDLYLIKVNLQNGTAVINSLLYTGYALDEAGERIYVRYPEVEPPFSLEMAELIYEQYVRQEQAGIRLS